MQNSCLNGGHGGHLGVLIGISLATFDLQITLIRPTKFRVNWFFGSGEKNRKIDVQDGGHFAFQSE